LLQNDTKTIDHSSPRGNNENISKASNFIFTMLESILGIRLTVLLTLCQIVNGMAFHCFVVKWFVEDIVEHLFHFIDENHVHNDCSLSRLVFNETFIDFDQNNGTDIALSSNFKTSLLSATSIIELLVNFAYFGYLLLTLTYKVIKNKKTSSIENASTIENEIITINNGKYGFKLLIRRFSMAIVFLCAIIVIFSFTFSTRTFSIKIECESFFLENKLNYKVPFFKFSFC
jgi:hypothetical protein